jgi:hypothetical protein
VTVKINRPGCDGAVRDGDDLDRSVFPNNKIAREDQDAEIIGTDRSNSLTDLVMLRRIEGAP